MRNQMPIDKVLLITRESKKKVGVSLSPGGKVVTEWTGLSSREETDPVTQGRQGSKGVGVPWGCGALGRV